MLGAVPSLIYLSDQMESPLLYSFFFCLFACSILLIYQVCEIFELYGANIFDNVAKIIITGNIVKVCNTNTHTHIYICIVHTYVCICVRIPQQIYSEAPL